MTRMDKSAAPFGTQRDSEPPPEERSAILRTQFSTGNRRAAVSSAGNASRDSTDAILRQYRDAITHENVLASRSHLERHVK